MTDAAYAIIDDTSRFEAVRRKRMMAFVVDVIIVTMLWLGIGLLGLLLGFVTFGLAWMVLFLVYGGLFWIIAILYTGLGIGGPRSATIGMRAAGLIVRSETGGTPGFIQGAAHAVLFYISVVMLTPLVLIVSLFAPRKRMLHDMLCGLVFENAPSSTY